MPDRRDRMRRQDRPERPERDRQRPEENAASGPRRSISTQAMPLVERALQVLERRAVQPQLGLLKSTMLQLDSAFNEQAYGAGSFSDFVEKLKKARFRQRQRIGRPLHDRTPRRRGPEKAAPKSGRSAARRCATCWKRTAWNSKRVPQPKSWSDGCRRSIRNSISPALASSSFLSF